MRRTNRILGVCVSALLCVTAMGVMSPANAQVPPNVVLPMDIVINGCTIVDNPTETHFTNCPGANLSGADLRGANLSYANLSVLNPGSSNPTPANLSHATLKDADLFGADLSGADLSGADLVSATLEGANLRGANLRGAILLYAFLYNAILSGANLTNANLSGAYLYGADLYGANLSGAYIYDAMLSESSVCPETRLVSSDGQPKSLTPRGAPINATVSFVPTTLSPANYPLSVDVTIDNSAFATSGQCPVHVVQPPLVTWGVTEVSGKEGDALTSTLGTMSSAFPSAQVSASNLPAGVNVALSPAGEVTVSGTPTVSGTFNRTVSVCNNAAVDPEVETCVNGNITFSIDPADLVINGCTIVYNPTTTNFTNCPGADLRGADLRGVNLSYANLEGANLSVLNPDGVKPTRTNLKGATLTNANLEDADLSGANLEDADLVDARLVFATFKDADLTDAQLRSARFSYANLENAILTGADLFGADLKDADLSGADLKDADLEAALIERAIFSQSSVCPTPRLVSSDGQQVTLASQGAPLNVTMSFSPPALTPTNTQSTVDVTVSTPFSYGSGQCPVHVVQPPLVTWGSTEVTGKDGDALTATLGTVSAFPSARVSASNLPAGVNVALSPTGEVTVSGTPTVDGTFNRTVSVCNNAAVDPDVETCVNGNITFLIAPADAPPTPPATPTPAPATPESTTPQPQGQPQSLEGDLPATGSTSPALVVLALALIGAGALLRRLTTAAAHS